MFEMPLPAKRRKAEYIGFVFAVGGQSDHSIGRIHRLDADGGGQRLHVRIPGQISARSQQ